MYLDKLQVCLDGMIGKAQATSARFVKLHYLGSTHAHEIQDPSEKLFRRPVEAQPCQLQGLRNVAV